MCTGPEAWPQPCPHGDPYQSRPPGAGDAGWSSAPVAKGGDGGWKENVQVVPGVRYLSGRMCTEETPEPVMGSRVGEGRLPASLPLLLQLLAALAGGELMVGAPWLFPLRGSPCLGVLGQAGSGMPQLTVWRP